MQRSTLVTTALVACLLVGCGSDAGGPPPTGSASTSSSSTAQPSTTTSSTTAATVTTTDPALAAALNTLAARVKVLKSNTVLDGLKASSTSGLTAARNGLKAVRAAAYPSETRSCSGVAAGLRATSAGASQAATAGGKLPAAAAARRAQVAALKSASATVTRTAGAQSPTSSPSPTEIRAAVTEATGLVAAETTSLNAMVAAVSSDMAKAHDMAVSAAAISAKVC